MVSLRQQQQPITKKTVTLTRVAVCVTQNNDPFWRLFDQDDNKYVIFDIYPFIRSSWISRQVSANEQGWEKIGNTFEINIPADVSYDNRKWHVEPHPRYTTQTIRPRDLTRGMIFTYKGAKYLTIAMQKDINGRSDARYIIVKDLSADIISCLKINEQTVTRILGDHDHDTNYHPAIAVGDAVQYGPFDAIVAYIGGAILLEIDGHRFQADPLFIVKRAFQMDQQVMLTARQGEFAPGIIGRIRAIQTEHITVEIHGQMIDVPTDHALPMGDIQCDDSIIPRRTSIFWDNQLWQVEGYLSPSPHLPDTEQPYIILHKHWQIRACVPLADVTVLPSPVVGYIVKLQEKIQSLERHIDNIELDSDLRDVALCLQDYVDKRLGVKS